VRKLLGLVMLVISTAPLNAASVQELIKDLTSKDNEVRRKAAQELGELGKDAKPALKALSKSLKDSDVYVRRYSAQAIGKIGPDASDTIPELFKLLDDGKPAVREAAIKAIGAMGSSAIPALTKALAGTAGDVQENAIDALGQIGESAVPSLAEAIRNPKIDAALRRKAIASVLKMGNAGKGAIPALAEAVKSPRAMGTGNNPRQMRLDAIAALGTLATPENKGAVKVLSDIANDEKLRDMGLKNQVRQALKKIESKK
jgi:HEAT repeat protein